MTQVSGGTFQLSVTGAPMTNGDKVAVPVRFQAQREGHETDMGGIDLLTIRDGSIVEATSSPRTEPPKTGSRPAA